MASSAADTIIDKSTLSDIYITDALAKRRSAPGDPAREKEGLLRLALAMAERPADVLPDFVALAMELTGATSAGLSLFEEGPGDGVFRWRCLHGLLARFENALTPRMDSPCGVTLDQNRPVLARHPELIYDWISAHGIIVPEVLLVPLHIGGAEPLGTLWVVAPDVGHFNLEHARITQEFAHFVGNALKMIRTETQLRSALDEQEIIAGEMNHRLKNLFAMTDGIIRGSARSAANVEEMAETLSARLHALSDAQALVHQRASAPGTTDRSIDLGDLIAAVVEVHQAEGRVGPERLSIAGPPVACGDHAINTIALIFHELATNAAKYGALSTRGGSVEIIWSVDEEKLILDWREQGGPPIGGEPDHEGFGTSLISRTISRHFQGSVDYLWAAHGLSVRITASLAKLAN